MNRNIGFLLLLFLILGGGTVWYLLEGKESKQSTMLDWDRKFKVEDTDVIHKIFIVKRSGEKISLAREADHWIYNEAYRASPTAMENLLRAIREMQMQYKPANAAVANMVRDLATNGIKVELYDRLEEKIKSYYIGGGTPDERGTYMIMENSEQPYVMHLPAWSGNLRFRFSLSKDEWRDKTVLGAKVEEIASLSIEYPKQQNKSFRLKRKGSTYEVQPFYDFTPNIQRTASQGLIEAFLVNFKSVGAEAFESKNPRRDSVTQTIPFAVISLEKTDGSTQQARLFPIYIDSPNIDPSTGQKLADTRVERYFAEVNEEEFMLVQHRVFEKILWSYEYFFDEV
ncbi:MAG: DUF4340 domain-containing protein [Bacteroidota bacterium]